MRVGVLGGGQLGRMLALAGYRLVIEFRFFDPNSGAPVGQLGELIAAPYDDEEALARFVDGLDVATFEFENVPLGAARFISDRVKMHPPLAALEVAQHRSAKRNSSLPSKFRRPSTPPPIRFRSWSGLSIPPGCRRS
jgi:Phosphoribosylaminoimidazole carboxylase (NCAIR synthetase)